MVCISKGFLLTMVSMIGMKLETVKTKTKLKPREFIGIEVDISVCSHLAQDEHLSDQARPSDNL